jgi:hypothetical protein
LPLWQHNLNSPFLPSDSKFNEPQYLHLNSNLPWKVTLSERAFSKGLNSNNIKYLNYPQSFLC